MNRIPHKAPFTVALIAALALLPAAACKKDSGGSEAASSIMSTLPADHVAVFGVNIAGLEDGSFVKKQLEENVPPEMEDFKEKCGIDPLTDVKQVLISFKDPRTFMIGAKVGFDQAKVEECVKEFEGEVTEEDGVTKVTINGRSKYLVWKDDVLLTGADKEALAKAGEGDGLAGNEDVKKYVGKANTGATVWGAGIIPASMKEKMGGGMQMPLPEGFYFSVKASKGVELSAGAVFEKSDDASKLQMLADMGMSQFKKNEQFGKYVEKVKLSTDGKELKVDVKLSKEDVEALQKLGPSVGLPMP